MQIPSGEHTARDWRIHELAREFRLEDVWALPAFGRADEFGDLVAGFAAADPSEIPSRLARLLWAARFTVGEWLGWDNEDSGPGTRVPSLRSRVSDDELATASAVTFAALPFTPLYLFDREFAAEIANRTMHGILHLSWVPDGERFRGVMAVYVKPNGVFGDAYMAAIRPFRHRVVYPPAMRLVERSWAARERCASAA